jgi:hypothetical protein
MRNVLIAILLLTAGAFAQLEFKQDFAQPAERIEEVVVDSPEGFIEIESAADNQIRAYVKKIAYLDDEDKAARLAGECKVSFDARGSRLEIKIEPPAYRGKGLKIIDGLLSGFWEKDLEILLRVSLPSGIGLIVETASADINISDLENNIKIDGSSADVCLDNIRGAIDMHLSSGDVEAIEINGGLSLSGSSSDFKIEKAMGDISVSVTSGDGTIDLAEGNLDVSTSSGDIKIFDLHGNLEAQTTSGDIQALNIDGSVNVETISGEAILRQLKSDEGIYYIETVSGDITCEIDRGFSGRVSLETVSGDIDSNIDMDITEFSGSFMQGSTGDGHGRIKLVTISGDIMLEQY